MATKTKTECPRCSGTGIYKGFGVCYRCNGRKVVTAMPKRAEPTGYTHPPKTPAELAERSGISIEAAEAAFSYNWDDNDRFQEW